MSKGTKIVLGILIGIIVIYIVVAVYRNGNNANITGDNQSVEQVDELNNDYISNVSYTLESGDNFISLISTSSGERSITNYVFENDKLSEIVITEEIFSGDLVTRVYESIINNDNLNKVYSSIEVHDNSIVMKLKDEYVDTFGERSKIEIFDEINKSMSEK